MEDGKYWQLRASEMRERAAHIKDSFISGGFLALAEQYDQLAASGARWASPSLGAALGENIRDSQHDSTRGAEGT
jgi:hypothetical protein